MNCFLWPRGTKRMLLCCSILRVIVHVLWKFRAFLHAKEGKEERDIIYVTDRVHFWKSECGNKLSFQTQSAFEDEIVCNERCAKERGTLDVYKRSVLWLCWNCCLLCTTKERETQKLIAWTQTASSSAHLSRQERKLLCKLEGPANCPVEFVQSKHVKARGMRPVGLETT